MWSWSVGFYVGIVLLSLSALVYAVALGVGAFIAFRADDRRSGGYVIAGSTAVMVVILAVTWWSFYPLKAEYHQWRQHSGTVSAISSRLLSSSTGKSTEQKFVVRFVGSNLEYGVNDTRAATVKVGDQLTVTCKRTWQYSGTDGYDCNYVSSVPAVR
jgi:hypothetical protein